MAVSLINTECKRYGCMKNLLACYANCRYSTRCDDLRNEVINNTDQASSDINKYLSERGKTPIVIQLMKRGLKFSEITTPAARSSVNKRPAATDKNSVIENPPALTKSVPKPAGEPVLTGKPAKPSANKIKKKRKRPSKPGAVRLSSPKESNAESATAKLTKPRGASYLEKPPVILKRLKAAKQKPQPAISKKSNDGKRRIAGRRLTVERPAPVSMRDRKPSVMPRRPKNETNLITADKEQALGTPAREQEAAANGKATMARPARPKKRSAITRGRSEDRNGKVYIILDGKSASVVDEQGLMAHLFANPSSGARYFEASEVEARVQIIKK